MEIEVQHPEFKSQHLTVEAAAALHGPKLLLNGAFIKKQKGRYIVKSDSGMDTIIQLKYNYLDPIPKIKIAEKVIEIVSPLRWYEYLWIGIPIALVAAGGAIGGLCGGLAANTNGRIFRSDRGLLAKYGLSALITLGAALAYVVLVIVFRLMLQASHK